MGMILTGIVIAFAIAIGAGYYLNTEQQPAWVVNSSSSTRVGDPGQNLVGPAWTGEPGPIDAPQS
jgi:Na+/H+-translocating membrane pyrophosphatase